MRPEFVRAVLASAAVYMAATLVLGRQVLGSLGTRIASDAGDPVLNAAILAWNATRLPWTDAWYQFPIFVPTANALTFSEHLLGVSLVASPVYWTTGNAIAAYNVAFLLSYALCGLAMFALVWRLTHSAPAAFLAGLAYAFAPYRASQLPHIQMLTMFWAPVALVALHVFADTAGRPSAGPAARWTWLALFACAWLLQGASNGYMLVYFSVLIGLWALWFLVSARRWRDTLLVVAASGLAALPLAPILMRYVRVHGELGLSRNLGEIAFFGADIAAPLCAPPSLTFWGWLRVACGPEGELFAGAAFFVLCLVGGLAVRRVGDGSTAAEATFAGRRSVRGLRLMLALGAMVYTGIALSVLVVGPWRMDFGWLRASASGIDKPLSVAAAFLLAAFVLSPAFAASVRRRSIATFYLAGAAICWVMSWGPFPRLLGADALYQAPFAWLLELPGVGGLRVPARFWMMSVLCLCVYMGIGLAQRFSQWGRGRTATLMTVAAIGLLVDGWMTIPAAAVPARVGDAAARGLVVLSLPIGGIESEVAAVYQAVTGQWRSVNGFSGYEPGYYEALRTLAQDRNEVLFDAFVRRGDLSVVVDENDAASRALVERQPGVHVVARPAPDTTGGRWLYRIPQRAVPGTPPVAFGERVRVLLLAASCSPESLALVVDSDPETNWVCGPQTADHQLAVDLGRAVPVGVVVHALGAAAADFPRHLVIETSIDGMIWQPAWQGSPAAAVLTAAMEQPRLTRVVLPFAQRPARYVRLRQTGREPRRYWSIGELEVWSGS